MKNIWR